VGDDHVVKCRRKKTANESAVLPTIAAPKRRQLMVGRGAVAVRSGHCDCSDDDASDHSGGDRNASDRASHHWRWSDWWRWSDFSAGLGEGLNRNQAQDCCGSEKFFHINSFDSMGNVASVFIGAFVL
jgi:hypothetical protein